MRHSVQPAQADRPPHLAIFLQDLNGGGAERMMLNLAHEWVDAGDRVDIVLVKTTGDYMHLIPPGARLVDLGEERTLSAIPRLRRYLKTEKPDALLSGLVHVNVAALLAGAVARTGTRIVISERNTPSRDRATPGFAMKAGYLLAPLLYPRADGITAVSAGVADDMQQALGVPRGRVEVINNPVVHGRIAAQAAEPFEHRWIGGPEPVIVAAGRLEPQKNYPNLLRAFALLRQSHPSKLLILGKGGERDALVALAGELGVAEHVDFFGFCANPYAVMTRADVFVLSSDWEGSPNVLVEAMFCGAPVVATDCPSGPRETLDGGRFGPLVPMNDAPALAAALASTLDAPTPAEILKARAMEWSAQASAAAYRRVLVPGR